MTIPATKANGARRASTVTLTAAQALVRFLAAQSSSRDGERRRVIPGVFGIFGHGNVCGLGEALHQQRESLRFYQPKNEQSMVHTAIGFAKATRRLSTLACTASIGPGSTNLVSGAATATTNRLPVLLLPADTFATRFQGPVLQQLEHPTEADASVNDCLRPVSRFFDRISRPEQLLTALPEAVRVLLDPAETGAVTISLHQDVQGQVFDFPVSFFEPRVWEVSRRAPAADELTTAVEMIADADHPLIIAGGGVRYSAAEADLYALATELGIPVSETSAGKGVMADDPLLVGGIGVNGTGAANALARDADLVICVGTRLTDFTTASQSLFQDPDVCFIGVNVASADALKLGAAPLVADAGLALEAVRERLHARGWSTEAAYRTRVEELRGRWLDDLDADLRSQAGQALSSGQVYRAVNRQARSGDWVVAAAGSPPGDLLKTLDCTGGIHAHLEFGYSCMGHEIPAGLGIRMAEGAAGEAYVVIGDGTYLMAPSELATAVQEGLKITVVVIVNGGYQSIHGLQETSVGISFGNEFRFRDPDEDVLSGDWIDVDFAANARSFGCTVFEVADEAELRQALANAEEESGPVVIVARVEARRGLLDSGAWWDLGVPLVSESEATQDAVAAREARRTEQRFYG